jgi:hypothetical protein
VRKFFWAAALVALTAVTPALAQSDGRVDTRAAYNAAFQDMLNKPLDPATVVRFVGLAEQVGDIKGAIAALERLLLVDPDQPRVQTELAALYLRLGVPDAARTYAESAIASPRATDATRAEARELVTAANDRTVRSKFSGDFFLGLQYSSNANSGVSGQILSGGSPVVPSPSVSRSPDWGVVGGGLLHHRYDLQTDDHAAVETDLAFYATRQFTVSLANVLLVDLTTGPRFDLLKDSVDSLSARPFFNGRYVSQGDLPTYWAYGSGVELTKEISPTTRTTATVLGRRREFQDNADAPTNSQSSGNEVLGVLGLESQLTPWLTLRIGGSATRYVAAVSSQSYQEYGTGFTAVADFADPVGLNGEQWTVTLSGNATFAAYDAPDPTVDPSTTRTQRDLVGSLILSVPIHDGFSLVSQATYTDRAASIVNYAYNAATVMAGVAFHF